MKVKIIHLDGCAATPETISLVKRVAQKSGITITLENIIVKTAEEAKTFRHIGSPTVQINSLDIDQEARDVLQFGLT